MAHLPANKLGYAGEQTAAEYLLKKGYTICEQNWRCKRGEIDIIAYDPYDDCLVFVEVKTRSVHKNQEHIFPELAVNHEKRMRYTRLASAYLVSAHKSCATRFDVIALTYIDHAYLSVHHIKDAFLAGD